MKKIIIFFFNFILFMFFIVMVTNAQQFKVGRNLGTLKPKVILELDDAAQALLLTRVHNPNNVIGVNAYRGMIVFDSSINQLAYYDGTAWKYPIVNTLPDTSIYNYNGTLTNNRTITMNANHLALNSTNGNFIFNPTGVGKIGIGISDPQSLLHINGTIRANDMLLLQITEGVNTDSLLTISNSIVRKISTNGLTNNIYAANGIIVSNRTVDLNGNKLSFKNGTDSVSINTTLMGQLNLQSNSIQGRTLSINNLAMLYLQGTNMAFGNGLRNSNIIAYGNVSVGYEALSSHISGSRNVAVGAFSLQANTTGTDNTATGFHSLYNNTTGTRNTALGYYALKFNNMGSENTALGINALSTNTNGTQNTAVGSSAIYSNTMGIYNVAVGSSSLYQNTIGVQNIAVGGQAFYLNTTGSSNIAIGYKADTLLGIKADNTLNIANTITGTGIYNANAKIGINLGINTLPQYALHVMGDINASSKIFAAGVQLTSDIRLKKDITPIKGALDKVLQLQGVTYTWRKEMQKAAGREFKATKDYGVIAQEIQKILPELVAQDNNGFFGVDYAHITPLLIEAIKEQHQKINHQQLQIDHQQLQIDELKEMIEGIKK